MSDSTWSIADVVEIVGCLGCLVLGLLSFNASEGSSSCTVSSMVGIGIEILFYV